MANYNTNLKRNKAFVEFLHCLRPGWQEIGGQLLRDENGNAYARTKWLPHQEWWQAYVQADRAHLKETEIEEFAEVIASGENCELTAPALRYLEFIAGYYQEMTGKTVKTSPQARKQVAKPTKSYDLAIDAIAAFTEKLGISSRKVKVVEMMSESAIVEVAGKRYLVDENGAKAVKNALISEFDGWARIYCSPRLTGVSKSCTWVVKSRDQSVIVQAPTAKDAVKGRDDYEYCRVTAYEKFNDFQSLDVPF